jgi:ketosteroid isomerase-like protein
VAHGKEAIREYFTHMMEGPDKVVESVKTDFIPDDLSVFYGDDVAVAVGKTDDHYVLADGKEFDIHARWTATLVRKDGRWLVGAFHYSTNVFDNPILDTQRKYLLLAGGGLALLLGAAGFLFGRKSGPAAG